MSAIMSCPKCHGPLAKSTMAHGIFWQCEACRGTAIGLDVLRRTFVRDEINAFWRRARQEHGSPAAACPSCRNQMLEVAATAQPEPRIEVCRICHFIWFDADELARLTPLPPKEQAGERELPPEARPALVMADMELAGRRAEPVATGDQFWLQLAQIFSSTAR